MKHAILLNNFGTLYWEFELYDKAEPLYLKALRIKETLLPPEHNSIAHAVNNLGLIYWKRGAFDQAEAYLRRALAAWEDNLGPDHSLVAWPLWGLAGTYRDQDRFEESEALYRRALKIRENILPGNDPELLKTRSDYARMLRAEGRNSEATELETQNRTAATGP